MDSAGQPPDNTTLGRLARPVQWTLLVVATGLLVAVLELARLPAALLLGAMCAGIVAGTSGATIRVHDRLFFVAQAIVGCLIARSFTPGLAGELARHWPVFIVGVAGVIGASALVGWGLARWKVLPGSAAVWGSAPGAASAMAVIAEAYGADLRLVAFMQYLRVVCVAIVASLVAAIAAGCAGAPRGAVPQVVPELFPPLSWAFTVTVALVGLGAFVAPRLAIPGGMLLLPMVAGASLQVSGTMTLELPPWLLASSYVLFGWTIGLRFTRPILAHAARALPRVLAGIAVLIAACGALGVALSGWAGVDPLTAYLATTPGGADSVAIIAASAHVDSSFVMTMQTARFLGVLFIGPPLARFVARHI